MGFAFVVVEKHTWRAVHLRNDNPFRAINDEGAIVRHQRHITHIDILLLDVPNGAGLRFLINIPNHKTQGYLQWRRVGHSPLLALLDVIFRFFEVIADEFKRAAF